MSFKNSTVCSLLSCFKAWDQRPKTLGLNHLCTKYGFEEPPKSLKVSASFPHDKVKEIIISCYSRMDANSPFFSFTN